MSRMQSSSVFLSTQRCGSSAMLFIVYMMSSFSDMQMDPRVRSAFDSVDALSHAISAVSPSRNGDNKGGSTQDVMTWLSAALTNQDTCTEGF
ncbi:hypothetical protein GQ457_04G013510 [Hibiscus cannabinus]